MHEGRPSELGDGLVSWEKMHLLGRLLRGFRRARGPAGQQLELTMRQLGRDRQTQADEALARNLHCIEQPAELMRLSRAIQMREEAGEQPI